jgi:hypothetical protein
LPRCTSRPAKFSSYVTCDRVQTSQCTQNNVLIARSLGKVHLGAQVATEGLGPAISLEPIKHTRLEPTEPTFEALKSRGTSRDVKLRWAVER